MVTGFDVPTVAVSKLAETLELTKVTLAVSDAKTPDNEPKTLKVAVVFPSSGLLLATIPTTDKGACVIAPTAVPLDKL